jgi:5-methylcytosine-specific restriction endonuclease McrA
MPEMPPIAGARSRREANRQYDARRGSARDRGYDARWDKASAAHRREHPFCQYCEAGAFGAVRVSSTTCTDHLYPHRGDADLFWAAQWWVGSCDECHAGPKQSAELKGRRELDRLAALLGLPVRTGG